MKLRLVLPLFGLLPLGASFAMDVAPPADQIASAVLAAPKERRAAATVLGYNAKGEVITLRKGTNDLICLADDPADKSFSVACYHKDLEPFMARGRELAAQARLPEWTFARFVLSITRSRRAMRRPDLE